jgi:cytochrome b pre-mRNA-processing protein 3
MILHQFRRPAQDPIIASLYGTIVAQARSPIFYTDFGVPDTVSGRFDMIVLHLVLFLNRLKLDSLAAKSRERSMGRSLGQEVFNLFCRDMDDNFREMGVGDLAVPREMRKVGEAFYGRAAAYEAALAADDTALIGALTRNIFGESSQGVPRLAAYIREAVRQLASQNDFLRAELRFPSPEHVALLQFEQSQQA